MRDGIQFVCMQTRIAALVLIVIAGLGLAFFAPNDILGAIRHRLRLIAVATGFGSAAPAFQFVQPPRSPYERRGLYHATIRGRVVSPSGQPVGGVHIRLTAGRPRPLPLADVVTGADGRFTLSDVNCTYPPYLTWTPPEEWLEGGTSVVGESASEIDVGVIQLRPASVVTVAVQLVGGPPVGSDRDVTVVLASEPESERMVAEKIGTERIIRGIPFEFGTWEVSLYKKSRSEVYTAPFHLQRGRRDQKFILRLLRDTVTPAGENHFEGRMEVSRTSAPATAHAKEFRVKGRVVGPGGSPVEGAYVSTFSLPPRLSTVQWVRTGSDGGFDLKYRLTQCTSPSVTYGDSDYWNLFFSKPSLREIPCEDWLRTPQTIVMPTPSRLSISVSGVDASKARAAWWHDSFGWQRFSSLRPWIPAWGLWHAAIRVDADGYLPLTRKLEVPYFDPSEAEPPAELPVAFEFDSSVRRTLSVRGSGKPLASAVVDVESIVNLDSDERRVLGSYPVQSDGSLELLGGADQMAEVFVYSAGFEPRRAIWNPGVPLVVDLSARSSSFEFPASSTAVVARIREAGSPRAVRTIVLRPGQRTIAPVAPGTYDITCYNAKRAIAGYQRLRVTGAGSALADCSVDRRPRLTVRLPGAGWRLSVSESTPPGGATQWAAMILTPGLPGFSDSGVTVLRESRTEPLLALSYAGKWHIEAIADKQTVSLWRDIDIEPGASMTLVLPVQTGTLKGSMRTYGGGIESSVHGFAGPRLQMIADDPGGWSVTEYIPQRDSEGGEERHRFTLTGIPAGNYHLFQHLIGQPKTYTNAGKATTYTAPIDAWGGIPVQIGASATTMLKDFSDYPLNDLRVRVTDAGGRAVEHATLRIRDRMSESWRQVEENPWQLEEAGHPIPYPAAVRIVGGRATLPRIREGWLDLTVESDKGTTFAFTVPVSPPRELTLKLPPEVR